MGSGYRVYVGDEPSRLDRELDELLSELRVALPGVQVLFAFLLTVPFATGFAKITDLQKGMFFVAFVATALSFIVLLAPTAHHRLQWRRFDKERLLRRSTRFTVAGIALLGVALTAAAFVVTDVLFSTSSAVGVAVGLALLTSATWFLLPLSRRRDG
jgi:amino acid transporter